MSPEGTAVAHVTPTATEEEKPLAAVAYVLTWLTGLIIFFIAKKEQRYARWNAVQSIAFGIAVTVVGLLLNIFGGIMARTGGLAVGTLFMLVGFVFWVLVIVIVVLMALKAYQGTPMRLPALAEFADKYA